MKTITETNLPLKRVSSGKVREMYELDEDLLMVATDRLSAFDVVFSQGIPYKGIVLTEISKFWFDYLEGVVKSHIKSIDLPPELQNREEALERRAMRVLRATPIKLECVVRGYLVGSGWKEYQKSGSVCSIKLPAGLKQAQKLPEAIFTPSTKAEIGEHDMNVSEREGREIVGKEIYDDVREKSLAIYQKAADYALTKGIILADTKFEFGIYEDEIILIDEVLTPDSSRYWPASKYEEGTSPPSYDKQYVRDYVEKLGWDKKPPAPQLSDEVIKNTSEKYIECYERITGRKFER
ncbi:phosphoribosylaminoimidazolesuccinocarboxamide synthase [Candidatus Micrarchaeota archaeon CG10_big_fil_rev_8_21_14_0_10_45_29]|nr:MAG: phosphoribosylaminoimidazolesuccinocarboxamide synthase [Candidatus Micrarchaeota archaeon CG10_big_fil_rev_8_21_14_0_10_45_29]